MGWGSNILQTYFQLWCAAFYVDSATIPAANDGNQDQVEEQSNQMVEEMTSQDSRAKEEMELLEEGKLSSSVNLAVIFCLLTSGGLPVKTLEIGIKFRCQA